MQYIEPKTQTIDRAMPTSVPTIPGLPCGHVLTLRFRLEHWQSNADITFRVRPCLKLV